MKADLEKSRFFNRTVPIHDRRMRLDEIQDPPQMDESQPIELESRDRRATGRR